jgi:hypothetical protein
MRHRVLVFRLLAMEFRDDHCPVGADAHLRSVTLAYPRALDEAERHAQPRNCRPHVRVGQDRHDGDWRGCSIDLHEADPATPRHPETALVVMGVKVRQSLGAPERIRRRDQDLHAAAEPEFCSRPARDGG